MIGVTFAIGFVALAGNNWLQHPTPAPAIIFGVVTVLAPFSIMQPSLGFGFAASKLANPMQARLRSLMNHAAFGVGLYLFALLVNWWLPVRAELGLDQLPPRATAMAASNRRETQERGEFEAARDQTAGSATGGSRTRIHAGLRR
jgi:hypothetical protein